ncbi:MAG TPA: Stp1/IreP family PP2C-type Ser/Thr phosphatase [Gaiellaceae bacterium]|nr:Stp1/IreP family PP2C-type Ser/Thr phosphatase [Gaiellaceae bacterium]
MKVADSAGFTDPGRKRRRNEDSYVIDPPLFAVADGMGGAQAGEVASRLAAAAFREFHGADDLDPEERLVAIIQEANRRIFERASDDAQVSGMGTTITAALVASEGLVIGHVGDSRAYRLRDNQFEQLTDDHSLVADLVRSGRLTPEEADVHPQRSVITRALGTDPEVDVDTFTVGAESGDLFLLCSDGLTTMVGDEDISKLLTAARDLEQAGKGLVKAANRAGGEDNVTVVLFRLAEDRAELEETAVVSGNGRGQDDDLEDTLTGLEAPTITAAAPAAVLEREREWGPAVDEDPAPRRAQPEEGPRWGRRVILFALGLAFVAAVVAAAFWALSRANFIGVDDDGHVAVYQGVPWELGAGVHLYRARYVSQLQAVQLTETERQSLLDHHLTSYDSARDRLAPYEEEASP